jgi:decaprenylphospho-beta-D-erythro-pentofuranosid-2-ulose 2-reductase
MKQKTLLILGARSEVAQSIAELFGRNGFDVLLAARNADKLSSLVADLQIRTGGNFQSIEFDLLHTQGHQDFFNALPARPDVVVCVVGLLGNQQEAEQDYGHARLIIESNFSGVVSILHVIAADFEKRRAGHILAIGSVAGDRGRQSNYIYGASKAGLSTFRSGLRNRLHNSKVKVSTIKPGFIRTRMTEGMKLPPFITAEPIEVAKAVYMAYVDQKNVVYVLWPWRYIMLIIKSIPEFIFKKLKL